MVTKEMHGAYALFTLENEQLRVSVSELGATITALYYGGKNRVLGYEHIETYLEKTDFLGATVGRYANRIGGAAFTLDGVRYTLDANERGNHLHGGGIEPWHKRRWEGETLGESVCFTLRSPAGDNGFPGNLTARVTYRLDGAALRMEYTAETDAPTLFAPTNHSFFDLSGDGNCLKAVLLVNASHYLTVNEQLLPLAVAEVAGTRFDYRQARPIGENLDHCFVLDGEEACTLTDGGVTLTVSTDLPALQVYTGSGLNEPYGSNSGVALEPEFYPDSPNHPDFPSCVLRPGERFSKYIEYRFAKA